MKAQPNKRQRTRLWLNFVRLFIIMPIATFSRRKSSKRQNSSDIEDERHHESPEEEHPQSRRDVVNGAKQQKKASTSKKQQAEAEDALDEDEDDEGRIDIENFRDQPLGRAEMQKLQGIGRDWLAMEREVRLSWRVVGDVAVSVADASEGDDAEQVLLIHFCNTSIELCSESSST